MRNNSTSKDKSYALDADQVLESLNSSVYGLSDAQVAERRAKYGWNEIPETKKVPWWLLLLKQFKSLLVVILIIAAAISYFADHVIDTYVVLAVVVINAMIGFVQEMRAEQAVSSLRKMMVQRARVIRNGEEVTIPAKELVPGDVIILEEGESIPADARVLF
ncbi:MAG TPA: cation-transporting P-type ATPase, partial [Flavobacteriaceae bacterium]|nr:cation-transporting P-type ATPase [Flavobacteriaceae bacterium]